jgi:hypothetical protein
LEIFAESQTYKTFVDNQIDKKIKMFCFDNGDEFAPREFNAFFQLHGITQQFTFFYSQQKMDFQNEKK